MFWFLVYLITRVYPVIAILCIGITGKQSWCFNIVSIIVAITVSFYAEKRLGIKRIWE